MIRSPQNYLDSALTPSQPDGRIALHILRNAVYASLHEKFPIPPNNQPRLIYPPTRKS